MEAGSTTKAQLRFEWQHRGSPHVHGLAWLPDTPHVKQLLHGDSDSRKEDIIQQADQLVSTVNLLSSQMAAISLMLQLPRSTHTSATRCMGMCRTSMRTWLIWWPPASDTPAAPLPTASAPSMASRSVASDIPRPCSPTQPSSQRKSRLSSQLGMTGWSTASTQSSCLHGVLMWTCSTLSLVREYCSTAPSTSPRVNHGHSLSRRSSPPSSVVSEKATPLSRQCRSCSSTPWERETTLPRRPATCSCSSPYSRHHVTSSSSASMGLVLLKTTWRRISVPQHSPSLATSWDDLALLTSTPCLCWSLQGSTPCPRPSGLSRVAGQDGSSSFLDHTSHQILPATNMSRTAGSR